MENQKGHQEKMSWWAAVLATLLCPQGPNEEKVVWKIGSLMRNELTDQEK